MNLSNHEKEEIDLTVVITCYNEEKYILDTIDNITDVLVKMELSFEIIVIDDVSKDESVKLIKEYIENHPFYPIRLIVNKRNRGLGNNYVEGAFLGKGKYYRLCCGDNPESKEVLDHIFRCIGKADMIMPCLIQKEVVGKTFFRKFVSRLFTFLVNLISGYKINYYNGMAIQLRYNVLRWHPSSYGFGFQADIITRLLDEGVSYIQIYSKAIDRKGVASSAMTMRNFLSVTHTLLEIAIRRLRRFLYGKEMKKPFEIKIENEIVNTR